MVPVPARVIHLVGFCLITMAMILHIVSVVTPYLGKMDTASLLPKVKKYMEERNQGDSLQRQQRAMDSESEWGSLESDGSLDSGHGRLTRRIANGEAGNDVYGIAGTNFEIGLFYFCELKETEGTVAKKYVIFGTQVNPYEVPAPLWLRWVRFLSLFAMSLMLKTAIGSFLTLVIRRKTDPLGYLRLLPYVLAAFCACSGVIALLGDIIFASQLKTLFKDIVVVPHHPSQVPSYVAKVYDLVSEGELYPNWGFSLDIVASLMAILAGVVYLSEVKMAKSDQSYMIPYLAVSSQEL